MITFIKYNHITKFPTFLSHLNFFFCLCLVRCQNSLYPPPPFPSFLRRPPAASPPKARMCPSCWSTQDPSAKPTASHSWDCCMSNSSLRRWVQHQLLKPAFFVITRIRIMGALLDPDPAGKRTEIKPVPTVKTALEEQS